MQENCLKFKFIRRRGEGAGWKVQNCINLNKIISPPLAVTAELKFSFSQHFAMHFWSPTSSRRRRRREISAEKMKLNWIPLEELKVFFFALLSAKAELRLERAKLIAAEVTLSLVLASTF